MKKGSKASNRIQFRSDTRIGSVAAEEDDDFLFDCFVDNPAVATAMDLAAPGMILSGRTGSGKTAVLRYIERRSNHVANVNPAELSVNYISNSDVFQFLNDIGADLDLFFQVIWKHVLCVSFIKLRYNINDEGRYKNFMDNIVSSFPIDGTRKRAIEYIQTWGSEFWISMDENVRSITQRYETDIQAEIGIDIHATKSKAGFGRNLSRDQKTEYVRRAQKIINGQQLSDLAKVMDLLSEGHGNPKNGPFYILIDRLDDRWADDTIKFRLIRALIETLRSFRKIRNLKIITALRADVLERAIQENRDAGFQREKYNDYIIDIKWNESQLKELVNRRIGKLYRWKYTSENVTFENIFESKMAQKKDTFSYLIERTLVRPRDIVAFVNECFSAAEGATSVSTKHVLAAEGKYSSDRLAALLDEWRTAFPTLKCVFDFFAQNNSTIQFNEIATLEVIEQMALPICTSGEFPNDPMWKLSKDIMDEKQVSSASIIRLAREIFSTLYRTGAVGLKRSPTESYIYSYRGEAVIAPASVPIECKLRIHLMLQRALGVAEAHHHRSGTLVSSD